MANWKAPQEEWFFNNDVNRIYRTGTNSSPLPLIYRGQNASEYTFRKDKNYSYRTLLHRPDNYNVTSSTLSIYNKWEIGYTISTTITSNTSDHYIYMYSKPPIEDIKTNEYITYKASNIYGNTSGIKGASILEHDFTLNGYSWVRPIVDINGMEALGTTSLINRHSPGWSLLSEGGIEYYQWFDISSNVIQPRGGDNNDINNNFKNNNYISKFIPYSNFNITFDYQRLENPSIGGNLTKGIRIYLSKYLYNGSNTTEFDNFISDSELVRGITVSGPTGIGFFGLRGNQYLVIVGDTVDSGSTQVLISNIKIEGAYSELNNKLFSLNNTNFQLNLNNATFSSIIGNTSTFESGFLSSLKTINSKIGNGAFKSGIWENGVWNNGWRFDDDSKDFFDIDISIKTFSDIKWRFRIIGPKDSVENFNLGDNISIGNIIGIDINNNRKLLKGFYKIIGISADGIDERTGYIIVETETTFPLRSIKKDSDNHRIKITRNIWLSGVFLNGFYTGVWNYGLFRGYPLITEMDKTQWIDGVFDGGHFKTDKYILGTFSSIFNLDGKVGLSFSTFHNLATGDILEIKNNSIDNEEVNITRIIDQFSVLTDKDYFNLSNSPGEYSTKYTTGVIQNMKFDSKNISRTTSVESLFSPSVFSYNSWIDVIYSTQSAVNIGNRQKLINNSIRKTYSKNNHYGYSTYDVLSSDSTFRDSNTLNKRTYKLGSKYKEFNDFIGDSSTFREYFGTSSNDTQLFLNQGWTFSFVENSNVEIYRSESNNNNLIGEELVVKANDKGVVLDLDNPSNTIRNRTVDSILEDRYSIVEFDLLDSKTIDDFYKNTTDNINYPIIHFNNINEIKIGQSNLPATYLPIYENINYLKTKKKRKVEYFFNKVNLLMNIMGNGDNGNNETEIIINNLKLYEVDMIPFFKYFKYENINIGVQIPLQGTAPYIDYTNANFSFIDNVNIGNDSLNIVSSLNLFSGVSIGILEPVRINNLRGIRIVGISNVSNVSFNIDTFNSFSS